MCVQYEVQINTEQLRSSQIHTGQAPVLIQKRLLPSQTAPVVVLQNNRLKLTPMRFSLIPSWSKDGKPKFATHNARIETILEKPAWRQCFLKQHCAIPLNHFFESVHEGPHAGHIIRFSSANESTLWAAGLFDIWIDPETDQKIFSFSMITHEPSEFIRKNGHDRSPLFIRQENILKWLNTAGKSAEEMRNELLMMAYTPDLIVQIERSLKNYKKPLDPAR